ncbi:hypothetical protein [Kribbella sp. NPDC051718]|uniref:hypothetical protein n=1 Tax=Kribbella sp. NPDC051718 TaxID=3155168 RepID=UPI003448DF69
MVKKLLPTLLGAVALTAVASLPSGATTAAQTGTTEACELRSGAITSTGAVRVQNHVATKPPGLDVNRLESNKLFAGKNVRLVSMNYDGDYEDGSGRFGYMVFGNDMQQVKYSTDLEGNPDGSYIGKVGSGWAKYRIFESSDLWLGSYRRTTQYAIHNDGTLARWSVDSKQVWHKTGTAKGYASFKSLALISQTKTYDTFLANTTNGRLYTIHIPTTAALKPILKIVRGSSWQTFESLQATRCGNTGVVLLAIDKNTKSGYLYAVGHANGTKTVIKNLGKSKATFPDAVLFNWSLPTQFNPPPYGE